MARMTLRLPDSLHDALATLAKKEGVSLNHVVVYALTQATAGELVLQQQQKFDELRNRYPSARAEEALASLLDSRSEDTA